MEEPKEIDLTQFPGRHNDPEIISCGICGWTGARATALHDYRRVGTDDVEPLDYCPNCGNEI